MHSRDIVPQGLNRFELLWCESFVEASGEQPKALYLTKHRSCVPPAFKTATNATPGGATNVK
jgi:hypothetical protein